MSGQSHEADAPLPTVVERLAERLDRPVDPAARARAARCTLDWIGCAVAARASAAAAAMRAVAPTGPLGDAFSWGALGNVLEMDDVDKRALLHPGPVVIPAALAVARSRPSAGAGEFLDAVARGYEAMIRLGRAVGPGHYRYWHNTATCGPVGAAAAAASLLGIARPQVAEALSLAASQMSGFWEVRRAPDSQVKQLHAARAAQSGVLAALLAEQGVVGVPTIFEGPQGFFAAACPGADPGAVADFSADAGWTIADVSVKPWPACRHAHAAIDAALALRAKGVRAADISSAVIRVYADAATFCDSPSPTDPLSARFSLQHSVAVALLDGAPTLADFEGERLHAPAIKALRERMVVAVDHDLTASYPARFGARLDIMLQNGEEKSRTERDAWGDPENPVTDDEVRLKVMALMAYGGLDRTSADELCSATLTLAGDVAAAPLAQLVRRIAEAVRP